MIKIIWRGVFMIFRAIFLSIFLVGFVSCNSSAPVQTTNMSNIIEDIPIEGVAEDKIIGIFSI